MLHDEESPPRQYSQRTRQLQCLPPKSPVGDKNQCLTNKSVCDERYLTKAKFLLAADAPKHCWTNPMKYASYKALLPFGWMIT